MVSIALTLIICALIGAVAFVVAGTVIWCTKGESLLPWGQRKRVERARANRDIAALRVEEELEEIKHLSLQPTRAKIMTAIEGGSDVDLVEELKASPFRQLTSGRAVEYDSDGRRTR